jgi:hypothetical protein
MTTREVISLEDSRNHAWLITNGAPRCRDARERYKQDHDLHAPSPSLNRLGQHYWNLPNIFFASVCPAQAANSRRRIASEAMRRASAPFWLR